MIPNESLRRITNPYNFLLQTNLPYSIKSVSVCVCIRTYLTKPKSLPPSNPNPILLHALSPIEAYLLLNRRAHPRFVPTRLFHEHPPHKLVFLQTQIPTSVVSYPVLSYPILS